MKKSVIYVSIILLLSIVVTACEEISTETFSGKDSIYFTWAEDGPGNKLPTDSVGVSFIFEPISVTDTIFKVPVSVQGHVSSKDRVINVSVSNSTAVKGQHFDLPNEILLRANRATDSIPVTFYKTSEMDTQTFIVMLKLEPNQDFDTEMRSTIEDQITGEERSFSTMSVSVNNIPVRPRYWSIYSLGVFTIKKLRLMSELLDIPLDHYTRPRTSAELKYHSVFMTRYLNEKKAMGETIYEDDGTEMSMSL